MSYHNSPFHPEPLAAFPSGTPDRFPEARHIGELETPMRAHPAAGCPAALMLRERSMRKLTVAMLFMSAAGYGCAAHSQSQGAPGAAAAAASGADREGHFARSANDMSTCVAFVSHERHPELHFDLNVSPPMTVSAKKYQSDEQAIWVAEFHKAGPSETDAFLRNVSATASDLDAVWRNVENCAARS
jgi:hypothetical protein